MADKVLQLVVALFVGVYVARYLGPERFGILSFAMSFVALFGAFATLGLDGIVVRNAVRDPENHDEILGTAFGLLWLTNAFYLDILSTLRSKFARPPHSPFPGPTGQRVRDR